MKRVLVLLFGLLALGGCGGTDTAEIADAQPATATSAAPAAPASSSPVTADPGRPETTAPAARTVTVPKVVGQRLDAATSSLRAAGLTRTAPTDGTGQNRVVLNQTNWIVQSQRPAAGGRVSAEQVVTLVVVKPSDGGGGGGAVEEGTVPDVVCKDLQTAQDTLQAAGFYNLGSEDGTGQGRSQLVDRNWVVVKQSVPANSTGGPGTRIVLTSVKFGEPTGASGCPS